MWFESFYKQLTAILVKSLGTLCTFANIWSTLPSPNTMLTLIHPKDTHYSDIALRHCFGIFSSVPRTFGQDCRLFASIKSFSWVLNYQHAVFLVIITGLDLSIFTNQNAAFKDEHAVFENNSPCAGSHFSCQAPHWLALLANSSLAPLLLLVLQHIRTCLQAK